MAVATILALTGCYSMTHQASMNSREGLSFGRPGKGIVVRHVSEDGRYVYILNGLIPVLQPSMRDLVGKYVSRHERLANLRIVQQMGPVDVGINLVSSYFAFGLITTRTVTYEGDVISDQAETGGNGDNE